MGVMTLFITGRGPLVICNASFLTQDAGSSTPGVFSVWENKIKDHGGLPG